MGRATTYKVSPITSPVEGCGCTDPVRLHTGKRTTVFVGSQRVSMCHACLRERDQMASGFYVFNGREELHHHRIARGTLMLDPFESKAEVQ